MYFKHYPRSHAPGVTPQRLAAARRAVRLDKENNALTPELVKFQTPEERIASFDQSAIETNARFRTYQARQWREARRILRGLPGREIVLAHWNKGIYPGDPSYLLAIIRKGVAAIEQHNADLERVAAIGRKWREQHGGN